MRLVRASYLYCLLLLLVFTRTVVLERLAQSYILDLMYHEEWSDMSLNTAITPIPGPNGRSTAYLFQGMNRNLSLSAEYVRLMSELMENQDDFYLLASVRQTQHNSGTILSFASENRRYLELESSGVRDELRLYYSHNHHTEIETFPFPLADNRWHKVALGFSKKHIQVFIDCNIVYERTLKRLDIDFDSDSKPLKLWLGQRNDRHAFYKGAIEYVQMIASSQGILQQCPHANIACPTCSQFRQLEHSVEILTRQLQLLTEKLEAAESRISELENCECQHSCDVNGTRYRDGETWNPSLCRKCRCQGGVVECEDVKCPPANCKNPVASSGQCCPVCLSLNANLQTLSNRKTGERCYYHKKYYDHGERTNPRKCVEIVCQDGRMVRSRHDHSRCPPLNCPRHQRFEVQGQCCKYCGGVDYCGQGHDCHVNASCSNLSITYSCRCKKGFVGDGRKCEDVDECQKRGGQDGNYCHHNTECVNLLGSYQCQCQQGYTQVDRFSCTEHDECESGAHTCSPHAHCENTPGSYICRCLPGYQGDGHTCQPVCRVPCENGGICVEPDYCQCRKGFFGQHCTLDVNECEFGIAQCHPNSVCVNERGSYSCECKEGFHSSMIDNQDGALCRDTDECSGWGDGHNCPADTACVNTQGSYHCICENPAGCTPWCDYDGEVYPDGSSWHANNDVCDVCHCQGGNKRCQHVTCDMCGHSINASTECCQRCEPNFACRHQTLTRYFEYGQKWIYECQQCQCLGGEVDCWPLDCQRLSCTEVVKADGDCCPRCAYPDPCQADATDVSAVTEVCHFNGRQRRSGEEWELLWDRCTACECKGGHVCCMFDQGCDHARTTTNALMRSRSLQHYQSRARSSRRAIGR